MQSPGAMLGKRPPASAVLRRLRPALVSACTLPSKWQGDGAALDWKTIVQISRPGWWIVHVWLYLAPTGQKYDLLSTWRFWLGLIYALFPLNLLVYGLNDWTDVELDANNSRKGNFMYGAKCTREQMRDVPRIIVLVNVLGVLVLAAVSGQWLSLSAWLVICFAVNCAYNVEPLRLSSKGPWELPCVVFGFSGVTALASIVNEIPWASMGYWLHMSCLVLRTQLWTEYLDYDPDLSCGRRTTSTLVGKFWSKVLVVTFVTAEAAVTWVYFDDTLMRIFSLSGVVAFVGLEVVRGTNDREKKKAMKAQNALGLSLVFWIWYKGIFAS
mmetsp:Transcript_62161/g.189827  ORF Transcript_62161/g.189827 Transcript_62161/m.189827 type:complete len:326 (-) Transcript_62161:58-1035(-)